VRQVFSIRDCLYGYDLTVFVGTYDQMEAYISRRWKVGRQPQKHFGGQHFFLMKPSGEAIASVIHLPHWDCTVDETGTLMHEINHAAMKALGAVGVGVTSDDHEAFCYYAQYLFSEAFSALCSEWKKCDKHERSTK